MKAKVGSVGMDKEQLDQHQISCSMSVGGKSSRQWNVI